MKYPTFFQDLPFDLLDIVLLHVGPSTTGALRLTNKDHNELVKFRIKDTLHLKWYWEIGFVNAKTPVPAYFSHVKISDAAICTHDDLPPLPTSVTHIDASFVNLDVSRWIEHYLVKKWIEEYLTDHVISINLTLRQLGSLNNTCIEQITFPSHLETLVLTNFKMNVRPLANCLPPTLRSLELKSPEDLLPPHFTTSFVFPATLTALTNISIQLRKVSPTEYVWPPNLQTLDLLVVARPQTLLDSLPATIRTFKFVGAQPFPIQSLVFPSSLTALTDVWLEYEDEGEGDRIVPYVWPTQLRHLVLRRFPFPSELNGLPLSIETFEYSHRSGHDLPVVVEFPPRMTALTTLVLDDVRITSIILPPRLECLSIDRTSVEVSALPSSLERLTLHELNKTPLIFPSYLTSLATLNLNFSIGPFDDWMVVLPPQLKILNIDGRQSGYQHLLHALPSSLESLCISGIEHDTVDLSESMHLKRLSITSSSSHRAKLTLYPPPCLEVLDLNSCRIDATHLMKHLPRTIRLLRIHESADTTMFEPFPQGLDQLTHVDLSRVVISINVFCNSLPRSVKTLLLRVDVSQHDVDTLRFRLHQMAQLRAFNCELTTFF